MKRLVLAFLLVLVVPLLAQAVSAQVRIYDTIYSADGSELQLTELVYTGATPRYRMADGLGVSLAVPHYLTGLDFVLVIASAGSYTNVTADIEVYNAWDPGASVGSVFSNLAGAFTANLGDFNPTGATGYLITLDVPSGIVLDTNPNKGVVVTLKNNGVLDSVLTLGVVNRPPNPGSEVVTDLWYRDANANGIIESTDARTFAEPRLNDNIAFTLWAQPVPEPATLLAVGMGIVGVALRRRRRV